MKVWIIGLVGCLALLTGSIARADILAMVDGRYVDGKIVSVAEKEILIKLDGSPDADPPRRVNRSAVIRIIYCDDAGAVTAPTAQGPSTQPTPTPAKAPIDVPPEPVAPPIAQSSGNSYYLIPLHGEVGGTILASALEKSLADAVPRKPSVIILDIDSPGGLVDESLKIMKVIGHYNKQAKIVAFVEQDLSAAAIFTLSVKTIYVKQLGTIGAATSFIPGRPDLSAKVEEKMQSAWRAAARNSAEEGEHNPLLAEAMIDNDRELSLETVDGKPVIKEGPGAHMLVRKGKILTLTSHEAVACGLAAGRADDLAELGAALGYKNWTECKGIAAAWAEYLPKQHEAFQSAMSKIGSEFEANFDLAVKTDPTGSQEFVEVIQRPVFQSPMMRGPMPGRPYVPVPGRPFMPAVPQNQIIARRVVVSTNPRDWKPRALACVVALQGAETNIDEAVATCRLFGRESATEALKDLKNKLSISREKIFKERNKYGAQLALPVAPVPPIAPSPAPSRTPSQLGPLASDSAGKAPIPDGSDAKLKQIEEGWHGSNADAASLLPAVTGISAVRNTDQSLHIPSGGMVCSPEYYGPTVTFRVVLLTSGKQVRVNFAGSAIYFNSTMHPGELRLYIGPAHEKHKPGAGELPKDQWVGVEFTLKPDEMIIYVDGAERYRLKADFSRIHQQFAVKADNGDVWVKSIDVIQSKEAANP